MWSYVCVILSDILGIGDIKVYCFQSIMTWNHIDIARQGSCGKVMFSQVSVCHSVHGRGTSHASWDRWGTSQMPYYLPQNTLPLHQDSHPWYTLPPGIVTSGGDYWRRVQTCSFENIPYPLGVLSSGSNWNWNWNTYGFQAGGMHPTGMLSHYNYCHW